MNKRPTSNAFILTMFLASWVISTTSVLSIIHFMTGIVITQDLFFKAGETSLLANLGGFFVVYVINESAKKAARRKSDGGLP